MLKQTSNNYKVKTGLSLNMRNWMIYDVYTRKDFSECSILIQEELNLTNGYNEFANYMMGMMLRDEGKIQESLNYFNKCNVLNPKNVENIRQIGRSMYLLGKFELAIKSFLNAEKYAEFADWNIYFNLGICYMKVMDLEKAKDYLLKALHLNKSEPVFTSLSNLYQLQQDVNNAMATLKNSLRLYNFSTDLGINLALIYMKRKEYTKAFNQLGIALAHDLTNPNALFTFSAEIQRHGEYDVAISKYKIAAQSIPESAELWNNIGMCFFGKRKYVAAITCLKRSIYLCPLNWLTLYNLGLLHLNTRQHASAAIFLSSAAKLNPNNGSTYTLLAIALKHLDDITNCKKSFEEALKLNPDDVEAGINYALYLFTIGEKDLSIKCFNRFQNRIYSNAEIDAELLQTANLLRDKIVKIKAIDGVKIEDSASMLKVENSSKSEDISDNNENIACTETTNKAIDDWDDDSLV